MNPHVEKGRYFFAHIAVHYLVSLLVTNQMLTANNVVMSNQRVVCPYLLFPAPCRQAFCAAYENSEITTHSHPDAFPSSLRQKRKTRTKIHEGSESLLKVTISTLLEKLHAFYAL